MYPNLAAEMARKGIKQKDIAEMLKIRSATVSLKLSRKAPLMIDEAFKIKMKFFPECPLEYLFELETAELRGAN